MNKSCWKFFIENKIAIYYGIIYSQLITYNIGLVNKFIDSLIICLRQMQN